MGWDRLRIRGYFERYGILIQEWDRVRTDWITLRRLTAETTAAPAKSEREWVRSRNYRLMLRDKNLVPLSRQHQRALALCVRLDRAFQAREVDPQAWQSEMQQIFEGEIALHFATEEKELFPVAAQFSELQPLLRS